MSEASARTEWADRRAGEQAKAEFKYGTDALLPSGRPDYDVLDYMINELVGMVRYAEMNKERLRLMEKLMDNLPKTLRREMREGAVSCDVLGGIVERYGIELIELRQNLKSAGLMLGKAEGIYDPDAR